MNRSALPPALSVAALLTAFAVGAAQFAARLWPAWEGGALPALTALTALEAQFAWNFLRGERLDWFDPDGLRYILAEWGALALLYKAAAYFSAGLPALRADALRWQAHFGAFFTPAYLGTLAFGLFIWALARQFAADLERLRIRDSDRRWEQLAKLEEDRHTARRRLGARLFGLGALLVLLVALTRLDASQFYGETPASRAPLAALVTYFALGLLLLGQTWMALLRGRWWWQSIPVQAGLTRRWTISALMLLGAAGALALLLPARYTLGLLEALALLLQWGMTLGGYLFFALMLLVSLLMLPLSWVMRLLTGAPVQGEHSPLRFTPPPPPAAPQPLPAGARLPWGEALRGVLFWALFLGALLWIVTQYLRQNRALWEQVRRWPLAQALRGLGAWLRAFLRGAREQAQAAAAAGRSRLMRLAARGRPSEGGLPRRRGRSARRRIFFYYRAMLRRTAQAGLRRAPAETPRQFARRLGRALPESQDDLHALTEAFIAARYAPAPADESLLRQARAAWKRLRPRLRGARQI